MEFTIQKISLELEQIEQTISRLKEIQTKYSDLDGEDLISLLNKLECKKQILNERLHNIYTNLLEYADFVSGVEY